MGRKRIPVAMQEGVEEYSSSNMEHSEAMVGDKPVLERPSSTMVGTMVGDTRGKEQYSIAKVGTVDGDNKSGDSFDCAKPSADCADCAAGKAAGTAAKIILSSWQGREEGQLSDQVT